MKPLTHQLYSASIVTLLAFSAHAGEYPDPTRFSRAIQNFLDQDRGSPPPTGAIVAISSSSMRGWHGTIHTDLRPLTIIPRGFGGSNMNDVLHYADRIVVPYRPRAILLYEGDNDTNLGISPAKIRSTFDAFVSTVHRTLPKTRIYVLSIKPSIRRWHLWSQMEETNTLLKAACDANPRLTFIDIGTPMLDVNGDPIPSIFKKDNLHMNASGYEIWTEAVRPVLIEGEAHHEADPSKN
jgi:lysophospholipase L1-like esterase